MGEVESYGSTKSRQIRIAVSQLLYGIADQSVELHLTSTAISPFDLQSNKTRILKIEITIVLRIIPLRANKIVGAGALWRPGYNEQPQVDFSRSDGDGIGGITNRVRAVIPRRQLSLGRFVPPGDVLLPFVLIG